MAVTIRVSTTTAKVQAQPVQAVTITPTDGARVLVVPTPGPPGPAGSGSYIHTQTTASAVWDVTHNLGQMLVEAAAVYSSDYGTQYAGVIVEPLTSNMCRLFFGSPVSGRALIQG